MAPSGSGLLTELRSSLRDVSKAVQDQNVAIALIERQTESALSAAQVASTQFADLRKGLNTKVESVVGVALQSAVQRQLMTKARKWRGPALPDCAGHFVDGRVAVVQPHQQLLQRRIAADTPGSAAATPD